MKRDNYNIAFNLHGIGVLISILIISYNIELLPTLIVLNICSGLLARSYEVIDDED